MCVSISLTDHNRWQSSYNSLINFEVVFLTVFISEAAEILGIKKKTGARLAPWTMCQILTNIKALLRVLLSRTPEWLTTWCLSPQSWNKTVIYLASWDLRAKISFTKNSLRLHIFSQCVIFFLISLEVSNRMEKE